MSGETKANVSGWSIDTALEHLLAVIATHDKRYAQRFDAAEKAVADALIAQEKLTRASFAASEKAIEKSDINAEKWRANANEWRSAMTDREGRFAIRSDMEALKERIDRSEGKGVGISALWGFIVGGIGVIATAVAMFMGIRAPAPAATPQVVYVPAPPNTLLPTTPPQQVPR